MLNVVTLHGRLGADPELKTTRNNKKTVSFTLFVDRNGKDVPADRISIVAWDKTAENICKHFKKGQQIIVKGSLRTRTYTDKVNKSHLVTEVLVDSYDFCGSKSDRDSEKPEHDVSDDYADFVDESATL